MHATLVCPYDPQPPTNNPKEGHVGGVEKAISKLSESLAQQGHDITLLCSTKNKAPNQERNGVHVIRKQRKGTLFRDPIVHLAPHIPTHTDIVHVTATYPFTTPTTLTHTAKNNIPSILDFHFEPSPNNVLEQLGAFAYEHIAPLAYHNAQAVLVRSKDYARNARTLQGIPEDRWEVIPNGIDSTRFHASLSQNDGDYILFVGRLVPYKGLNVLLDALNHNPPSIPLKIAGEGPLRGTLEAQANDIQADIHFLGYVKDQDLPRLYQNARVTVLPSLNKHEAFGITLLESMACGTPVVASDLPGVKEVASHGGLLAKPGNAESLARHIQHAIQPGTLPQGEQLANRIHDEYAWHQIAARLEEIYASVLEKDHTRRR